MEPWTPGRAQWNGTIDEKAASFKDTPFQRGDKVKVKGAMKRAMIWEYPHCWNGPKLYDCVELLADYIIIGPTGEKYISTTLADTTGVYRFWLDDIMLA